MCHITEYTTRKRPGETEEELEDALQTATSDTLVNHRAIKLCLHSTTIISILSNKEGCAEDQE